MAYWRVTEFFQTDKWELPTENNKVIEILGFGKLNAIVRITEGAPTVIIEQSHDGEVWAAPIEVLEDSLFDLTPTRYVRASLQGTGAAIVTIQAIPTTR